MGGDHSSAWPRYTPCNARYAHAHKLRGQTPKGVELCLHDLWWKRLRRFNSLQDRDLRWLHKSKRVSIEMATLWSGYQSQLKRATSSCEILKFLILADLWYQRKSCLSWKRSLNEMMESWSTPMSFLMGMAATVNSVNGITLATTSLGWWGDVRKWLGQWNSCWEERSTTTTLSSWWRKLAPEDPLSGTRTMGIKTSY